MIELNQQQLDSLLVQWVELGWIRELDRAFARFLQELVPDVDPLTLFSAALVSHQLGRGHICLALHQVLQEPDETLAIPPDAAKVGAAPSPSQLLQGLDLSVWRDVLAQSQLVEQGEGDCPLVLDGNRLYLRRYWQYEQQVAAAIRSRLDGISEAPAGLAAKLEQLFLPLCSEQEKARQEINWQMVAAALAARSSFTVISGGPGTGKTTTVVRLLGLLQELALESGRPIRIRLAAPTGKAAARLTESITGALSQLDERVRPHVPAEVTTLHRLLKPIPGSRQFQHHRANPLHLDLLVIDEASMVDLEMMACVLDALPPRARLILLGDKDQLASVEAGAVLGELCRGADNPGYSPQLVQWLKAQTAYDLQEWQGEAGGLADHIALLRKSHRFDERSGIGQLAKAVNAGDVEGMEALWYADYTDIGRLTLSEETDALWRRLVLEGEAGQFAEGFQKRQDNKGRQVAAPLGYRHYLECIHRQRPAEANPDQCNAWAQSVLRAFGQFQILSPLRQGPWGVEGINRRVESILGAAGLITPGQGAWYEGRPVLVTRNDYGLGLMNGDVGIALRDPLDGGRLRVFFAQADGSVKKVLPSRLAEVETVFAMTVHKSQGSEFTHTLLVLPDQLGPVLTRELVYTGITRARDWFTLAGPKLSLVNQAVLRQIQRSSGLGMLLQKPLETESRSPTGV